MSLSTQTSSGKSGAHGSRGGEGQARVFLTSKRSHISRKAPLPCYITPRGIPRHGPCEAAGLPKRAGVPKAFCSKGAPSPARGQDILSSSGFFPFILMKKLEASGKRPARVCLKALDDVVTPRENLVMKGLLASRTKFPQPSWLALECGRQLWKLRPKLHYAIHMLDEVGRTHVNPMCKSSFLDEDHMKHPRWQIFAGSTAMRASLSKESEAACATAA